MARLSRIIVLYLTMGAVMWGGGAIDYQDAGVATFFVDANSDDVAGVVSPEERFEGTGGALQQAIAQVAGPVLVIWNLVTGFIAFLNWPIVTLASVNAPPRLIVLLGGPPTAAFYMGIIRLIRSSA